MTNFRSNYPNLSDDDTQLFLYLVMGFSPQAISIILNIDIKKVYNRKSSLKRKVCNVTDIDFFSLMDNESNESIVDLHKYFMSQKPTEQNNFTGIFEDKNIIFIMAESFDEIAIDKDSTYRIMTWNLGCMVSDTNKGEVECVEILLRYLPDVMGLQECNSAVHSKVLKNLPSFYAFANKTHNGSSTVNYTPIIYNTELFTLIKSDIVWLRGRYTGTNTKSLNWAVLEDKTGAKFAVINYHGAVCSNSYKGFENYTSAQLTQQALDWKLDNVVQVIEVKNAIIAEFGNIPIMVSGDNNFNSS